MKDAPTHACHTTLSDAAIDDLREGLDSAGVDTQELDRHALNRFGVMLLRAHLIRIKLGARQMQKNGKDAIIPT